MKRALFLVFAGVLVLSACSGGQRVTPDVAYQGGTPGLPAAGSPKIQHVIIVIQENRSFDNFFATFPGADGATYGLNSKGKKVTLVKKALLSTMDLGHGHPSFETEWNGGNMNGFDKVIVGNQGQPGGNYAYQYVDPTQIAPYWTLAKRYALADHMFQTQTSGSFTAHQDLIAGGTAVSANASVIDVPSGIPWGCDAPSGTTTPLLTNSGQYEATAGPFPCFSYATLRDLLDAHHVTWKYYTPPDTQGTSGIWWNAFDAIASVRCATYTAKGDKCSGSGTDWKSNISTPAPSVLTAIKNNTLPNVSWVIPDTPYSDHPGGAQDTGPAWVASIVNAVGANTALWKTTAIIVVWDDWGGWYDNVKPPKLDAQGLGFRVPMIVVSPYARRGYVSHQQFEFGSILRFIEDNWQLGQLGSTDVRARSLRGMFDYAQAPGKYVPVKADHSASYFLSLPNSNLPVDTE